MRLGVALLLLGGCGKQLNDEYCAAHMTDDRCTVAGDAGRDAQGDGVIGTDALTATKIYVAATTGDLYSVDVGTMQSELIGTIEQSPGVPYTIDALGFLSDGTLVAATDEQFLVHVDPTNAAVTSSVAIAVNHNYIGMTVAPAGELGSSDVILVASDDDSRLAAMNSNGSLRDIGSFGGGLAVAGDLAWVPGVGLFASVKGSGCTGTCIASVSTTNGDATLLKDSGPSDLWALAAYKGQLWAIGGSDDAYQVDQTTGGTTQKFSTGIDNISDAAP